jgi:hypothetical protein
MSERFIVKTASAKMPSKCWGRYARVAVIELNEGYGSTPYIKEGIKQVKRIVELWDKCHVGKTDKGEFQKRLKEAHELCAQLNAAVNIAHCA